MSPRSAITPDPEVSHRRNVGIAVGEASAGAAGAFAPGAATSAICNTGEPGAAAGAVLVRVGRFDRHDFELLRVRRGRKGQSNDHPHLADIISVVL